jgi:cation-transporting P-type ATPase F
MKNMENMENKHWHNIDEQQTLKLLETDMKMGLSDSEFAARVNRYGPNQLTPKQERSALVEFLLQFHNPLVYILLVATIVTFLLAEYVDSAVIFGVILVNAIIGFVQERKAKKAIDSLKNMLNTKATVIRNGRKISVLASDVTLGDIILLTSGDKVPADCRLVQQTNLKIDESTLTGESVAVEKRTHPMEVDTVLADRINMAYGGTLVTYGQGTGVVTAIGDYTETGKIAHLINEATSIDTPLTKKITAFSKTLLWMIISLSVITFVVGYFVHGSDVLELFMASVALAVAAIPEGLPAVVTITLAIGVRIMAQQHAIIRKLPAVETLGSTTVICSDKTGTLTKNEMTVTRIAIGENVYRVGGNGYLPEGDFYYDGDKITHEHNDALREILLCGLLCNDSHLINTNGVYHIQGDPTEGALLVSAQKYGLNHDSLLREHPRLDSIPFESDNMYMATLHSSSAEQNVICIKGSLERILQMSKQAINLDGEVIDLDTAKIEQVATDLAQDGLRVLAFAVCYIPGNVSSLQNFSKEIDSLNIHFVGLQAMIDPPRPEAIEAVALCHQAGITVKMITGDHKITAVAIAKELGINSKAGGISGAEMEHMSDSELKEVAMQNNVFARVAPEQKLKLVSALQASNQIVAMTGDGVNDAPALKQADIGIAMGINGTEVSKEAADMVLADDNFASIASAVQQGRGVFDNLIKFIAWILPTNVGQGLVIMLAVFVGQTLPVSPVQALWLNMTTALFLGLMLAFEPREKNVMKRKPRNVDEPILNFDIIVRIFTVSFLLLFGAFGLFILTQQQGASVEESRTLAVTLFVVVQSFYLLNCRTLTQSVFSMNPFSNKWIPIGITLMLLAQLAFVYIPIMNTMFGSAPIGVEYWLYITLYGIGSLFVIELQRSYMMRC